MTPTTTSARSSRHPDGNAFRQFQYLTSPLSRSRGGIHDLLDLETARSVAEHLSDVHEAIQAGEGVSGPAARRLINSAAQEHHRFGGMVATVRQARTLLLSDPTLNVFDNPEAYLTCNYDPSKALCHPVGFQNSALRR